MIDSEQVQEGRLEVVNVDRILGNVATAPLQEQLAEAGQHKFPSVRVNPSSDLTGMRVTLVPSTVSAVVEARGPEASTTLPGVPVLAASPVVETAERFKIVVDESTATLPSIKVFGPQEKIDLLKSGKFSPAAIFRPDYTIPQGTTAEAPIIYFDLPPGVHASPSDLVRYSIRYTVQPRKSPDQ